MFENIHPNMYDGDEFKGSSLEGKSLRVVVSEVIYKHNVLRKCSPNDYVLGPPWPEREVNLV